MLSKGITTSVTYPAIRCKVMLLAAESDDNQDEEVELTTKKTTSGAMHAIWIREGLLGFFKGLKAQILKIVLSSVLLLMIKEKISKTWVLLIALRRYLFIARAKIKSL
ncbi:hypothetical protein K2173_016872 [Erythroxylum novogranatense]|uniref:Uncharacterized protein n=1 Tax=Erythroxylum novogranatense TaxID=1862640 RepID=A0AAV8U558_9ROSI|nr:hypothetical protein K2173_016872 [Erythroxylum novogranatense]